MIEVNKIIIKSALVVYSFKELVVCIKAGMIATEITYIGEWDFTQYRRNAPFLMKI